VGGDFFGATGLQVRRGRGFGPEDSAGAPPVVILNEAAARDYFGDEDAVGRMVRMDRPVPVQIVGVVSDAKYRSVREDVPRIAYSPSEQDLSAGWGSQRTMYVHTVGDASRYKSIVEATVRSIDRTLPLYNVKTFSSQKAESLLRERLMAALSSFSGVVTLAMAAIALYGLISFGAVSRTREIGIRISLGADRARVVWLVLRSAIGMVVCGCAAGVGLGMVLARFVRSQLYAVSPTDLTTLTIAIGVLLCAALVAALVPAMRASRVDPTVALRSE
jgi:ABC-type antimicrobial peptide transport system permease subunit